MTEMPTDSTTYAFQAEIQQVLHILVHSLYTEREIFLRELVSNASDALSRAQFQALTDRDMRDLDAALDVRVTFDEAAGTLTVSDTGIGMTRDDLINNLGVIAKSGAKAFIEAMQAAQNKDVAQNVIGQFGVGFYSVFMAADHVRVVTQSHRPDEPAWAWECDGGTSYTIAPAERARRGTDIIVTLKPDARDLLVAWKIKDIIRKHSDYVSFPIFVGDEDSPTNQQTALWRRDPKTVEAAQYNDLYKTLTYDFADPLKVIHLRAEMPLEFYTLLFVPSSNQPSMFNQRKQPGLKLYARKVLIQEYCTDLLPEYLSFVQGVVDSEDLPLNVSRETVRADALMAQLRRAITKRVLSELRKMSENEAERYAMVFENFGRFIKQGVALSPQDKDDLLPLLLFPTTHDDSHTPARLSDYVGRMVQNQRDIYYIVADDLMSARNSPHLEAFTQRGIEVLFLTDPVDPIMLTALEAFDGHTLRSVDDSAIDLSEVGTLQDTPDQPEPVAEDVFETVRQHFEQVLGERVLGVRASKTLVGSAARLVSGEESGAQGQMFRVNRLLQRDYELPVKQLELNPRHPLIHNLGRLLASGDALVDVVVEQVFETAQLQDGIHPDPASMAQRITQLMEAATRR
ncbi:MAG: molecular chaperone HtpG [Anaerolineae bacterium]|jgi:molecular chaperone HtpG|nr:molecular chaperone HtpG [Anaerolineae bacterium]